MPKFGVEIEYIGDNDDVVNRIRNTGLSRRSAMHGYIGHSDSEWVIKRDGSVYDGGECVSPPLDFENQSHRDQVTTAINALVEAGAVQGDTCGIHVHIDAANMTVEQLACLARCFYKFQDVIYRLASSGWDEIRRGARNYAFPLDYERTKKIMKATNMSQLMAAWYNETDEARAIYYSRDHGHNARYCGLNLHSYFYRRTIEFRIFNSSMNPERVQMYIAMCVAMVEDAMKGNKRSINKCFKLGGMRSGETNEANAFHRFQQCMRYDAGMSLEDMRRMTKFWKDSKPQAAFSRLSY